MPSNMQPFIYIVFYSTSILNLSKIEINEDQLRSQLENLVPAMQISNYIQVLIHFFRK